MTTSTIPPLPVDVKTAPPVTVTVDGGSLGIAGAGVVYNVPVAVANVEASFALPNGTKAIEIKTRNSSALNLSYAAGTTATDYVAVPSGQSYTKDMLNTVSVTVYFQTAKAPEVVQFILYS